MNKKDEPLFEIEDIVNKVTKVGLGQHQLPGGFYYLSREESAEYYYFLREIHKRGIDQRLPLREIEQKVPVELITPLIRRMYHEKVHGNAEGLKPAILPFEGIHQKEPIVRTLISTVRIANEQLSNQKSSRQKVIEEPVRSDLITLNQTPWHQTKLAKFYFIMINILVFYLIYNLIIDDLLRFIEF